MNALPTHRYRVRYPTTTTSGPAVEVACAVDLDSREIDFVLPDQTSGTVDEVGARALASMLYQALYQSLQPNGPQLTVERNTGHGWHSANADP